MSVTIVGLGGARRNAGAALCRDEVLVAACERERITRTRGQGMLEDGFPDEAVDAVAGVAGVRLKCGGGETYASAEGRITAPPGHEHRRYPHHYAHAAAASLTSPFHESFVLVCDRHDPEVSLWRAWDGALEPAGDPWKGPGFARLYGLLAKAFDLTPDRDEHRLEALARLAAEPVRLKPDSTRDLPPRGGSHEGMDDLSVVESGSSLVESGFSRTSPPFELASLDENGLRMASDLTDRLHGAVRLADGGAVLADLANRVQSRVADLLIEWVTPRVRPGSNLCLAGGLFYNTYFNTRLAEHPAFGTVFVPTHPGNTGLAVGCALAASADGARTFSAARRREAASPFIGPAYTAEEIKATVDNCKLSYEYVSDGQLIEQTVAALRHGHLVGWFHGAMEWGPRALGHRSILASPASPYVLENLNRFLKRREVVRSYGVSVREEDAARFFTGPASSPFMQFDYRVRDPELFRHVVPPGSERLRVHTVGEEPRLLRSLLAAFGSATGLPALVNTSFNGFHEPIVCTPRDAVRVFYGTGLDMLVMGNFVLRK